MATAMAVAIHAKKNERRRSSPSNLAERQARQNGELVAEIMETCKLEFSGQGDLKNPDLTDEQMRAMAATRMQRAVRTRIIYSRHMHRGNLQLRLQFESELKTGAWRLFTQVMVFAFLLIAIGAPLCPLC